MALPSRTKTNTVGGSWEFERDRRALAVRVEGQLIVNDIVPARQTARDGAGIAYLPEDYVRADVGDGGLVRVPAEWCPPFPGYYRYYRSRRQLLPAMSVLIEALRSRSRLAR